MRADEGSDQSEQASSSTIPTSSARQTGAKNGGPALRRASSSGLDDRNISTVTGPSLLAARAGGRPARPRLHP